jgi:hypothetical protein
MNRIDFIKNIFFGALGISGLSNLKDTENTEVNSIKRTKLITTNIAGFDYYDGLKVEKNLKESDILKLKREEPNLIDIQAIEVYWNNHKLGYIPRNHNTIISKLMDSNKHIEADIRHININSSIWNRIYIGIYMS